MKIEIEWLSESNDCDQAGCSGGWGEGAIVKIDGEEVVSLVPEISCFGGTSYSSDEVYAAILKHLGHEVTSKCA